MPTVTSDSFCISVGLWLYLCRNLNNTHLQSWVGIIAWISHNKQPTSTVISWCLLKYSVISGDLMHIPEAGWEQQQQQQQLLFQHDGD